MLRTKYWYSVTETSGLIPPCTYKSSFAVDGNDSNDTPFNIPVIQLQLLMFVVLCRLNWWVMSESSYLLGGNDVSSAVTDVDK